MQLQIREDLLRAAEDGRSVVVIDGQGDLIRTIAHLDCFSPTAERSLADRLVLIDPNDVEYPVCLNMFDFQRERLDAYRPVDQEKILNGTIELYEYFFGALLGAELTQKQGVILKYLARLMLLIPDATIHTFRELMEDGEPYGFGATGASPTSSRAGRMPRRRTFDPAPRQCLTHPSRGQSGRRPPRGRPIRIPGQSDGRKRGQRLRGHAVEQRKFKGASGKSHRHLGTPEGLCLTHKCSRESQSFG